MSKINNLKFFKNYFKYIVNNKNFLRKNKYIY